MSFSLERVPETGRLRFMDVSEAQEREVSRYLEVPGHCRFLFFVQLGHQTQLQTLQEYSTALLPPNHPTTKRVRKVASRIIESSNLGRVKSGGEMGAIEGSVPKMGGGDIDMGDIFFGGGAVQQDVTKDTEWEVCVPGRMRTLLIDWTGVCH